MLKAFQLLIMVVYSNGIGWNDKHIIFNRFGFKIQKINHFKMQGQQGFRLYAMYIGMSEKLKILISIYMEGPSTNSKPCTRMHLILHSLGVKWVHMCRGKFQAKLPVFRGMHLKAFASI